MDQVELQIEELGGVNNVADKQSIKATKQWSQWSMELPQRYGDLNQLPS